MVLIPVVKAGVGGGASPVAKLVAEEVPQGFTLVEGRQGSEVSGGGWEAFDGVGGVPKAHLRPGNPVEAALLV